MTDKKRDEEAKTAGAPVADKDVIAEVASGARTLGQRAAALEKRAFAGAPEGLVNTSRPEADKTAVLVVDDAATASLLKRTLASLKAAGYARTLLHKPDAGDLAGDAVLPLIFRTTEGYPEGFATRKYKRPIIVHIRERDVQIFPPNRRTARREKTDEPAEPLTWPVGAKQILEGRRLAAITLTIPDAKEPLGGKVAQAVRKIQQLNDPGNVILVEAVDGASAGRVLEVADALTALGGAPLAQLTALEPGLQCEGPGCPTHLPVLFSDVRIPKLREVEKKEKPEKTPAGYCDRGNIGKVVKRRAGSFRFCYEKELQLHPELKGGITVRFTIGLGGGVTSAAIAKSSLGNRRVEACVLSKFKGMRFAKPDGGVCVVNWPLTRR